MKMILSLLIASILLSGCQSENVEKLPHEAKPEIDFEDPNTDPGVLAQASQLLVDQSAKSKDYWDILRGKDKTFQELYMKILMPLEAIVLKDTYFRSSRWKSSDELNEVLSIYNEALSQAMDSVEGKAQAPSELAPLLDQYMKVMFSGCMDGNFGMDISRGCYNLNVFAGEAGTIKVVLRIAEMKSGQVAKKRNELALALSKDSQCKGEDCTQLKSSYLSSAQGLFALLKTAYVNRNASVNEKLNILWQKHLEDNYNLYAYSGKTFLDEWQKKANCQIFSNNLNTIDLTNGVSAEQKEEYLSLLDRFKPYSSVSKEAFCLTDTEKLKTDWFKHRLFEKNKIDPRNELKKYISDLQQVRPLLEDPKNFPLNHSEKLEVLKKNRYTYDSLGLVPPNLDIYFYIIDEIFRGNLNTETATVIWQELERNDRSLNHAQRVKKLYGSINKYLRVEIAYMSLMTNLHFKRFFEEKDFASKDIFSGFLAHASILKSDWRIIKESSDRLLIFLEDSIEKNLPVKFGPDYDDFQRQKIALKGMKSEINYVSVWPNMMVLSYFLAKFKGTVDVYIWWLGRSITIDLSSLVVKLLEGQLSNPWFDYGDPNQVLSKYQVIHAFDFWVRTDVMASYKNVKENIGGESVSIVDEKVFFDVLLEKYLYSDKEDFEKASKGLATMSESVFKELYSRCENSNPTQYFKPDKFMQTTFIDREENFIAQINNAYGQSSGAGRSLDDLLDRARSEFSGKIKLMGSFLDILNHYKDNPPVDVSNIDDVSLKARELERRQNISVAIKSAQEKLDSLVKIRNEFIGRVLEFHQKSHSGRVNCFKRISEEEQRRRNEFMEREIEYLKDVHAAMVMLSVPGGISENGWNVFAQKILNNGSNSKEEQQDLLLRAKAIYDLAISKGISASDKKQFIQQLLVVNNLSAEARVKAFGLTYIDSVSGETKPYSWSGLESIQEAQYKRHVVDTILRMRHFASYGYRSLSGRQFAPVASGLVIELETDFPKWQYLQDGSDLTQFKWRQTEFVRDALLKVNAGIGSYIGWYKLTGGGFTSGESGAGEYLVNFQVQVDQALLKWGRLPVGAIESCGGVGDGCTDYPASRLVRSFNDLVELMNLSEREKEVIEWLGLTGKYESSRINAYFVAGSESTSALYRKLFDDVYDYRSDGLYSEIERLYTTENTMFRPRSDGKLRFDYSIFPFSKHVISTIRNQYRPSIMTYFDKVFELVRAIHAVEQSHKGSPVKVALEWVGDVRTLNSEVVVVENGWKVLVPRLSSDGTPIYLDALSLRNFQDSFVEFFTNTKCALLPTEKELKIHNIPLKKQQLDKLPSCKMKADLLFQAWSRGS